MLSSDPGFCAPTQDPSRLVTILDGPTGISLQLGRFNQSDSQLGFIRRVGHHLVESDGITPFKLVGANVYWLGLDENVSPSPSYPSQVRVLEVLATAAMMGATVVRSTTLGVSVGTPLSVWPTRNTTNTKALDVISFAIFAAKRYGLRLIIPLTDEYDYYHGGYRTFLRWRSISEKDTKAFYEVDSDVYQDFLLYLGTIFDFVNPFTQLAIKDDPTVMMWETGNELAHPTRAWTEAIANWIHSKTPKQLVTSGRYGISKHDLTIEALDGVTNHFYPPRADDYRSDASKAVAHGKVYYAGEFDWSLQTQPYWMLGWVIIPLLAAITVFLVGQCGKVFPFPLHWPPSWVSKLNQPRHSFNLRHSHVALFLSLLVAPITGGLIWVIGIRNGGLEPFLTEVEGNYSNASGALYWSLFGHDDQCCNWVEHKDGFALNYPGQTPHQREGIARLIKHAYTIRRQQQALENPITKIEGDQADWLGIGNRVQVTCPQSLDK